MDAICFSIFFFVGFGLIYEQMVKLIIGDFEELPNLTENLTNIEASVNKIS